MTRARRLVLLALAALLPVLAISQLPLWSSRLLAQGLSSFFQRPATVGSVQYRFFPLAIEVRDVRVAGPDPNSPPFLEVPRLVAVPALRPLWERRAVFSRLHLRGVIVRIHAYPDGSEGLGLFGLREHLRTRRQDDFLDNLCRKLMSYALGRGLIPSDEPTLQQLRARLAASDHHFGVLVEGIVSSPQFLTRRGRDYLTAVN